MNFTIKQQSLLFFFALLSIGLAACCKKEAYPDISADELSWLPYHQGDTIVFKKTTTGDTLKYYYGYGATAEKGGPGSGPCYSEFSTTTYFTLRKVGDQSNEISGTFQNSSKTGLIKFCNSARIEGNNIGSLTLNSIVYNDVHRSSPSDTSDRYSSYYICKGIGIVRLDIKNSTDYFYLIQ